jgi:hypothetical protein
MLKRLAILIVFGAFLTGWPSGARSQQGNPHTVPPTHVIIDQGPPAPDDNSDTGETKKSSEQKSSPRPEWAAVYVAVIYLLIGGGTLFALWRLVKTMEQQAEDARALAADAMLTAQNTLNAIERQADIMQDAHKKQLRAYLCISQARLNFSKDGQIKAQIHLKNTGQTPAYKIHAWGRPIIQEHPLSASLERADAELLQADGILPPGGEHILITKAMQSAEAELISVYTPNYAIYVHGECSYRDIFGATRTLEYRLIFGGPAVPSTRQDPNGDVYAMLSMDMEGNEERDV